jgi:hypothetical protein
MQKKPSDKQVLIDWEQFRQGIIKNSSIDLDETLEQQKKRKQELEADPEKWKRYYFKKFFKHPSPEFHAKASKRLVGNFIKRKHWYEVRHWVRGLSKTTTTMMDVLYLVLTGKLHNIIYTSSTYDDAEGFLERYRAQLDSNQRIINDYGGQELPGSWSMGSFKTRNGVQFLALGAGQSPRGNLNEEVRPDCIIVDDFDTDEECLNPDIITKKWNWFERALFFTVDTAEPYLVIWLGNIISEDCCVVRAGKIADHTETINIRDGSGKSTWPEKNSEEDIDYQLSKVSYEAGQQEMFNNPMRQGQAFKEIKWGKCVPLKHLKFAVTYCDPATSNKDKPSAKAKSTNSSKAVFVVGYKWPNYYIYTGYLDIMNNSDFVEHIFDADEYVGIRTTNYKFIENNTLQDPFYQQVIKPLIREVGRRRNKSLSVLPDERQKPEKWFRIEGGLEPINRAGHLIFNVDEKDNPHMKRLASQFLSATPNSKTLDGPDCIEGAKHIIDIKMSLANSQGIESLQNSFNAHRY